jgi:hypothetical protein
MSICCMIVGFRSDESEPDDGDTVERDALLLAQTYTSQETRVSRPGGGKIN